MRDVPELLDGYRKFRETSYPEHEELYRSLAAKGQSPKTMIVACCDSRLNPSAVFNADPGQLFILRNVANLVPPHEPHSDHLHGTSAALEFAVTGLGVENILVLGHARCGGVKAYLEGLYERAEERTFIDRWMSLLRPARAEALRDTAGQSAEATQQALELASVRHSIENLRSFPFVRERLEDGRLRLHGGYFDIGNGKLLALDAETGKFAPLD